MATSSTGIDNGPIARVNRRVRGLHSANPTFGEPRPEYVISAQYGGPPLQDDSLLPLAENLAKVEVLLFQMVRAGYLAILQGRLNHGDADAQMNAQRESAYIQQLTHQFEEIQQGRTRFAKTYLSEEKLLHFYFVAVQFLGQMVEHDDPVNASEFSVWLRRTLASVDDAADRTWPCFVDAASNGVMDSATTSVLRRKWRMYEDISVHANMRWSTGRRTKPWREIADAISSQSDTRPHGSMFVTLWLTVFATLCNIATFALAFYYSPPGPGFTHDADFWLLLQGSIMQWFSLLIATYALWNRTSLPKWSWLVPTTIALICSVIAIPLYLRAPTAWSAFATTVGSAVQAFMTVQVALVGEQ